MNIDNKDTSNSTIWIGTASVIPVKGSFQQRSGLIGGYAFVAFRSDNIVNGIRNLYDELIEGGTQVVGFEWLSRFEDNERELLENDLVLIDRLSQYPVQFEDINWFEEE